jgi:hypothetical protein
MQDFGCQTWTTNLKKVLEPSFSYEFWSSQRVPTWFPMYPQECKILSLCLLYVLSWKLISFPKNARGPIFLLWGFGVPIMFLECSHQVPNVPSNQEEGKSWVSCICSLLEINLRNQSHSRRLISILGKNIVRQKPWKSLLLLSLWCGAPERETHTHSYKRDNTKKSCGNTKVQDLCHHAFDEIRQSIWSFSRSWDLWRWDQIQAQGGATERERERVFLFSL